MASKIGDIAGDADPPRSLPAHVQLRLGTGLLLIVAALALIAGWALRADGRMLEAVFGWRVAFFSVVSAALLNGPILRPLFRGGVHFSVGLRRSVPFRPSEFEGHGALDPKRGRSGVIGQTALVGALVTVMGVIVWLGGLAFSPFEASGTVGLRAGQRTSDVRPVGLRVGVLPYGFALPHEHAFLGLAEDGSEAAILRALDPRTGDAGEYAVAPGTPVLLGPHRVSLASTATGPPISGLAVRVEGQGVDQRVTLRRGLPVSIGTLTLELVERSESFLESQLAAARVRLTEPSGSREIWLVPEEPGIDAAHGYADSWTLTPLSFVGTDRIELRFTERWVWWWRLLVLAMIGGGAFLLLLVPHRTWVWTGRPGDLELRTWSLNASSTLGEWSSAAVRDALGPEAWGELLEIERELAEPPEGA